MFGLKKKKKDEKKGSGKPVASSFGSSSAYNHLRDPSSPLNPASPVSIFNAPDDVTTHHHSHHSSDCGSSSSSSSYDSGSSSCSNSSSGDW
ncbi:hypothetical protein OLZ31_02485 [Enterobacter asburiae]|nr:hypothetical protein [Enterobacter asburiae]